MKAIVFNKYGSPKDVLHLEEVKKPVLVKIKLQAGNPFSYLMKSLLSFKKES